MKRTIKQEPVRIQYSTVTKMYSSMGGQRYFLVLLTIALCTVLLWHGKLNSTDFATVILGTVGVYITGRTYQKTKLGENE